MRNGEGGTCIQLMDTVQEGIVEWYDVMFHMAFGSRVTTKDLKVTLESIHIQSL